MNRITDEHTGQGRDSQKDRQIGERKQGPVDKLLEWTNGQTDGRTNTDKRVKQRRDGPGKRMEGPDDIHGRAGG
jgi:hypothetical protein